MIIEIIEFYVHLLVDKLSALSIVCIFYEWNKVQFNPLTGGLILHNKISELWH